MPILAASTIVFCQYPVPLESPLQHVHNKAFSSHQTLYFCLLETSSSQGPWQTSVRASTAVKGEGNGEVEALFVPCILPLLSLVVKPLKCLLTMHTVQASALIMRHRKERKIYLLNCNSAGFRETFPPQHREPCFAVLQSRSLSQGTCPFR